jgi:hypothetical protein
VQDNGIYINFYFHRVKVSSCNVAVLNINFFAQFVFSKTKYIIAILRGYLGVEWITDPRINKNRFYETM